MSIVRNIPTAIFLVVLYGLYWLLGIEWIRSAFTLLVPVVVFLETAKSVKNIQTGGIEKFLSWVLLVAVIGVVVIYIFPYGKIPPLEILVILVVQFIDVAGGNMFQVIFATRDFTYSGHTPQEWDREKTTRRADLRARLQTFYFIIYPLKRVLLK